MSLYAVGWVDQRARQVGRARWLVRSTASASAAWTFSSDVGGGEVERIARTKGCPAVRGSQTAARLVGGEEGSEAPEWGSADGWSDLGVRAWRIIRSDNTGVCAGGVGVGVGVGVGGCQDGVVMDG